MINFETMDINISDNDLSDKEEDNFINIKVKIILKNNH